MGLMALLSESFAKASPTMMPAGPSFDEVTQKALKQIQDCMASIGTLQEAASKAAAEVQRSYDQIGTLDEAAQRALDQSRANYEKIGTLQEAAASAYKTVIENSRKMGFASGTALAGAFRKAHKPVPEGCEEAGAFMDELAKLTLDFQASAADRMFAPPPSPEEGSDLEDQQTDYQQQVNDLVERYAGDLDRIKKVADELAGLPPTEDPGETEPSRATTTWHIECAEVAHLRYSAPPTFEAQNIDPDAGPGDAQAATQPVPQQPGQGPSEPLVTLAAMSPGAASERTPASATGVVNATFDLWVKHLAADTAGVTPAGGWHGGLSAIVSATSTTRLSNGGSEFIAYDSWGSDDGTVTFQLELMGEPTPEITPPQAYYQGVGSVTLSYEAGGEYTLGPRQGKRAPKWSTTVFIPIAVEVADGNVTITMAGGTASGSISGRMLGVVSP
ncbi:hypothetical protein BRAO375_3780007 [Bradyrhizobium sp. ORS 375]|nr:hypothetical protein BRAO375_3780007 [Bradyrhizobium sp. ORS 375]